MAIITTTTAPSEINYKQLITDMEEACFAISREIIERTVDMRKRIADIVVSGVNSDTAVTVGGVLSSIQYEAEHAKDTREELQKFMRDDESKGDRDSLYFVATRYRLLCNNLDSIIKIDPQIATLTQHDAEEEEEGES